MRNWSQTHGIYVKNYSSNCKPKSFSNRIAAVCNNLFKSKENTRSAFEPKDFTKKPYFTVQTRLLCENSKNSSFRIDNNTEIHARIQIKRKQKKNNYYNNTGPICITTTEIVKENNNNSSHQTSELKVSENNFEKEEIQKSQSRITNSSYHATRQNFQSNLVKTEVIQKSHSSLILQSNSEQQSVREPEAVADSKRLCLCRSENSSSHCDSNEIEHAESEIKSIEPDSLQEPVENSICLRLAQSEGLNLYCDSNEIKSTEPEIKSTELEIKKTQQDSLTYQSVHILETIKESESLHFLESQSEKIISDFKKIDSQQKLEPNQTLEISQNQSSDEISFHEMSIANRKRNTSPINQKPSISDIPSIEDTQLHNYDYDTKVSGRSSPNYNQQYYYQNKSVEQTSSNLELHAKLYHYSRTSEPEHKPKNTTAPNSKLHNVNYQNKSPSKLPPDDYPEDIRHQHNRLNINHRNKSPPRLAPDNYTSDDESGDSKSKHSSKIHNKINKLKCSRTKSHNTPTALTSCVVICENCQKSFDCLNSTRYECDYYRAPQPTKITIQVPCCSSCTQLPSEYASNQLRSLKCCSNCCRFYCSQCGRPYPSYEENLLTQCFSACRWNCP